MRHVFTKLHVGLLRAEKLLLTALLLSLIIIAVTQVLMRNTQGGGLLWADSYTRISVLWIALLGAVSGSRQQNHLAIDALLRHLPAHWQAIANRINFALTAVICGIAAWFSTDFVRQEAEYGDIAFADIPTWWCESIIPFAFAVISLRYAIAVFLPHPRHAQTQ